MHTRRIARTIEFGNCGRLLFSFVPSFFFFFFPVILFYFLEIAALIKKNT